MAAKVNSCCNQLIELVLKFKTVGAACHFAHDAAKRTRGAACSKLAYRRISESVAGNVTTGALEIAGQTNWGFGFEVLASAKKPGNLRLLQLRVLGFGLFEDRNVGISVFPDT
jgi:hypothetical protein